MCSRYDLHSPARLVAEHYGITGPVDDYQARYSIAPSFLVPVVTERTRRELNTAAWGLKRSGWKRDHAHFNARLETIDQLPTFKPSYLHHRCLVPMDGFYEWTGPKTHRLPWRIHGTGLLTAAGILAWSELPDGTWAATLALVTTEGVDAAGEIHDRMPTFLTEDVAADWLDPGGPVPDLLAVAASSAQQVAKTLSVYRVDRRINSTRALTPTDPSLAESIEV